MGIKIYNFIKKNSLVDISTTVLTVLFTFVVLCINHQSVFGVLDSFNISILSSFIIVMIARILSTIIKYIIETVYEDKGKLETDYAAVCKQYSLENCVECGDGDNKYRFPIVVVCKCKKLFVEDSPESYYALPSFIEDNADELMEAHSKSNISNNIVVRCKNLISDDQGNVTVYTERSTYYDSLISNKAMDYMLSGNRTIRNMYEPGPFLKGIDQSRMSNHLGFNGFIISSDDELMFIRRGNKVAVNKMKWSCSVSASLKLKYSLDVNRKLTEQGIINSVVQEIKDELKLTVAPKDINVFEFYRDIIQGGKPEFYFYSIVDKTADEIKNAFYGIISKEAGSNNDMEIDGTTIRSIPLKIFFDSARFHYTENGITVDGENMKMGASYVVCLNEVLNELKKINGE